MVSSVLGLDIGGANLKVAHSGGPVFLQPFELWKHPDRLAGALEALTRRLPPFDQLAVTMTGELCDCFATKRQGVGAILDAVEEVAGDRPFQVWATSGEFLSLPQARAEPLRVAAANWLALATFAGRYAPAGPGLVIDIGSTTTDIIPLLDGRPIPRGRTDPDRLRTRELVYTGVRRTPLCALLGGAGAAEWFATTLDVYLVLGMTPEDPADLGTADGRPAVAGAAHARLARMLCADEETCSGDQTRALAGRLFGRQKRLIRAAVREVGRASWPGQNPAVVLAGSGEFLARAALEMVPAFPCRGLVSLGETLGAQFSPVACAYALTQLTPSPSG